MSDLTRLRLLAHVRQYPGLHQRELARQLEISLALVQYHAKALVQEGAIIQEELEGTTRFFPAGMVTDRQTLIALRDKRRLHIVLHLLEHGTVRHTELADATDMGKSTLSFHLRRLEKARVVRKGADGFALADAAAVRRLLDEHQPTPDLLDRFADLWSDLYG